MSNEWHYEMDEYRGTKLEDLPHHEMVITLLKALRSAKIISHSLWTQLPMDVCHDPEKGLQRYFTVRETMDGDRYWMLMSDDAKNVYVEGAAEAADYWIEEYINRDLDF